MKSSLLIVVVLFFSVAGYAQNVKFYNTNGVAINGYDPVSYFLQNTALQGSDRYNMSWSGSTWKFVSQAHLDSFRIAPEKYAPQYGGYCAFGCSENHKSPTDPKAFTIVGNKLYLNYNPKVKEF